MVRQAPQHQGEDSSCNGAVDETLLPIPGMLELVSQLKAQGYGLHLLFQRFTALLSISKPFSGDEDDGLCPYLRQYAPDQA